MKIVESGLMITLRVLPGCRTREIVKGEVAKIKLTAPPVDNKANKMLVEFLAEQFGVVKSAVELIKGENSRKKVVLVKTLDEQKIEHIKKLLIC